MLAFALAASASARAGDITWTGSASNLWNTTDANWSGSATTFTNGDNVLFSGTTGTITGIVSRSPGSTVVTSNNKITFATGIMGSSKAVGGPSILTGSLVKNGTGELELGDPSLGQQFGADRNLYSNSFTSVTVNGGTLRIRSRAALGTGLVTLAGGTKFIQASEEARFGFSNEQIDNSFNLSGGMAEFPMAFGGDNKGLWLRNGVISGPGGILVTGSGRSVALSGNNTFQGGVTLDTTGTPSVIIATYTALGTGTFTASQGVSTGGGLVAGIDLKGNATYPDGVGNDIAITAGKFLNVSGVSADASLRLSGDISGGGTLNKRANDSTVILSGTNTYSGGTIVDDGTLVCERVESLGTGPLSISAGAVLRLDFVGSRSVPSLKVDGGAFLPNGTYGSSASPAENQDNVHFAGLGIITVGPPKTATSTALALTGGANPSNIGTPVTLTATVSGGSVTGNVVFYDGLTQLGSAALNGSLEASITTSALPEGARNIIAQYQGNATFASSTSAALALTVVDGRPASVTSLALTGGQNPSAKGSPVTYTATVAGASPTGQVTFYDREIAIGSSPLDGSSQASITTSSLLVGPRTITAAYSGDTNNKPSSGTYEQVVDPPAGNGKLKVFILAGQSNMQGHGKVDQGRDPENPNGANIFGGLGSLRNATVREPRRFGFLVNPSYPRDSKGWATRSDVWLSYWDYANNVTVERRNGILDSGFGVGASLADGRIGPEYGFGQVVGSGLADKVLIIKTAWGGKSLYVDFRPPSSGGTTGPNYLDMVNKVHLVLNNLPTYYPGYDAAAGYEIAGFGWHQGWNDRGNASAVAEYEANLANLIRDLRTEFGVPGLPCVIANTGMAAAPSGPGSLIEAQGNVAIPALHPELGGNVVTVDTRPYDYGVFQSPIDQGYHWNGNGESYYRIGESMGAAMLTLQPAVSAFATWAANAAQGLTAGVNDGPSDDPDFDGITNLMEFVLRGNPRLADPGILPVGVAPSGGDWRFEYDRNKPSSPGVAQIVQYTTDFVVWTDVTIPAASAGIVTVTPGANTDRVSVAIPVNGTSGFARLKISQ